MAVNKTRHGKPVLSVDYFVGQKTFGLSANRNDSVSFYINAGLSDDIFVTFRQYCQNIF